MKIIRHLTIAVLALAVSAASWAAKPLVGPKGGRILTTEAPHAEFFVEKDRKVVVSFYDRALKPVAPGGQAVTATAETRSGKVKLEFAEQNGALVSKSPLPEGDDYMVVLQLRENANARPRNYRVRYLEEICGECKRAEYACTCDDAGTEHGHEHKKK